MPRNTKQPRSLSETDHTVCDSLTDGFDDGDDAALASPTTTPPPKPLSKSAQTRQAGEQGKHLATARIGADLLERYVHRMMAMSSVDHAIGSPAHRRLSYDNLYFGHVRQIRPTDFYRHLGQVPDYTLYCCARPVRLNEDTIVWVAIDIDNDQHGHLADSSAADSVRSDIESRMRAHDILHVTQASTHSRGFHVHFCVLFPSNWPFSYIRWRLTLLRKGIASCYAHSGCSEVCLKGLPFVSADSPDDAVFGTLVRSPLPLNADEATALIDMTNRPSPLSEVMACFEHGALVDSPAENQPCPASPTGIAADALSLSPSPSLFPQVDGQGGHFRSVSEQKGKSNDPLGRMNKAAARFARLHHRFPNDESELVAYYESQGLHTPLNDCADTPQKRRERATLALSWVRANHRFTLKGNQQYYSEWLARIKALGLTVEELTYTKGRVTKKRRKRGRGRSIGPEHVALTMALIDRRIEQGQAHVPKTFVIKASRVMAAAGEITFRMDDKKFAKAVKILVERGLLTVKCLPRKGVATGYGRGRSYEAAVSGLAPPELDDWSGVGVEGLVSPTASDDHSE